MTTSQAQRCPQCAGPLARLAEEPPWCPQCEWNLETLQLRGKPPPRGAVRTRARAFALNQALLAELSGTLPQRPATTRVRAILLAASAALLAFDLALLVGGGYLLVAGIGAMHLVGFLLLLIGLECRIRVPRWEPKVVRVSRAEAPRLFSIIDQACAALGGPRIERLYVTATWQASCGRSGLRGRTVLVIGLPLWASLTPNGRMALLGHELGHLVNGDPTTAFVTQPALTTFRRLAAVFNPQELFSRYGTYWQYLAAPLVLAVFWPVYVVCRRADRLLSRTAARDHQRAEAFADALGMRLGGKSGALELGQVLLFAGTARIAVREAARAGSSDPADWQQAVAAAIAERLPDTRSAEQISLRYEVSAFASHPPTGLRHRLIASWPDMEPVIPVSRESFDAADAELASHYARVRKAVVNAPLR